MNSELFNIFLQVGKYILASALMVIFYWLLYKEKSTYNQSRIFLLSIAFTAILVSQFNIVVYTPPAEIVEIEIPQQTQVKTEVYQNESQDNIEDSAILSRKSKVKPEILYIAFGYLLITSLLLLSLTIQYLKINSLKRHGNLKREDGFDIVVNSKIPTPFSFGKTIFCGSNLTGDKLNLVIKHEKFHIFHRHYIDVIAIEILVRLLWFNPVLWWIRKELRNLSEFQSDRSVLDEGNDLYKYQTIILEEVMSGNPYLANGLNNSFTKKRFIMMKKIYETRFNTLRHVMLVPFMIGVFSIFCFSTGKSQVKYVVKNSTMEVKPSGPVYDEFTSDIPNTPKYGHRYYYTFYLNDDEFVDKVVLNKAIDDFAKHLTHAINDLENNTKSKDGIKKLINFMDIRINNKKIEDIEITDELNSSFTQEDIKSSTTKLNEIKDVIVNLTESKYTYNESRLLVFNLFMRKMISVPVISKAAIPAMNNLVRQLGDTTSNIVFSSITKEIIKNQKKDASIWSNAYIAKPEQISISKNPYKKGDRYISSIERKKRETRITISIPIGSNEWWVRFDKNLLMIDKKTRDPYLIKRLDNDLPLNTTIKILGFGEKVIDITLIFPPLKESIDIIDIEELITDKSEIMSSFESPISFRDLRINDYTSR